MRSFSQMSLSNAVEDEIGPKTKYLRFGSPFDEGLVSRVSVP